MTWSRAASRLRHARLPRRRPRPSRRDIQHRRPTAPGRTLFSTSRQRHHRSHRCRAHSVRGSGPARRQHHDQRSDRNRREAGRHRPGGGRRTARRWSGGHGFHHRDQRPSDHGHRQQRRGHGVGSGQHRDDLQLRDQRPRSALHQWPTRHSHRWPNRHSRRGEQRQHRRHLDGK